MRNVEQIYRANSQHWVGEGFLVQPLFSRMAGDHGTNPFLMPDYAAPYEFAPNEARSPRGVGQHPRKGFETVTPAYHGEVAHRDSGGGGGVIHAGDVQWMTAGFGIIHEELYSENSSKTGGLFEMVQLWVNLPARYKNAPPRYQLTAGAEEAKILLLSGVPCVISTRKSLAELIRFPEKVNEISAERNLQLMADEHTSDTKRRAADNTARRANAVAMIS